MGSIVTIAQSKGGSGKTALTQTLAVNLAIAGYRVALLDADPNQTLADWHDHAYEGPALFCASAIGHVEIVDRAAALADAHDVVLVDTAGFQNLTAAAAMTAADLVLIPCMPDRGSARETIRTAQQLASLSKAARRAIPYSIVLTRWNDRGIAERHVEAQLAGWPVSAQRLPNLAAFAQMTLHGAVPVNGAIGRRADGLIDELAAAGAIADRRAMRHRSSSGYAVLEQDLVPRHTRRSYE